MKKILLLILASLLFVTLVTGCSSEKEETPVTQSEKTETPAVEGPDTAENAADGIYNKEGEADDHGWTPFVELEIKDKKIISVNFDYENEGKMKTEDADYIATMEPVAGTSPDIFIPEYENQLMEKQDMSAVDTVTGATTSYNDFTTLVKQALSEAEGK